MSVTACYARVNAADLGEVERDREQFWKLNEMSWDLTQTNGAEAGERLYVDKDWQVLSWLCSETGRAEERYQAALMDVDTSIHGDEGFKAALAEQVEAMGFKYVDPRELPSDPVLTAIQGRREGDAGPTLSDLGLAAAVFSPQEVEQLAAALNNLDEGWLRERFDVRELEALCMPCDCEATELDEFYLPQLERLKALYNRAVAAGQHVVVVMC